MWLGFEQDASAMYSQARVLRYSVSSASEVKRIVPHNKVVPERARHVYFSMSHEHDLHNGKTHDL